LIICKRGWRKPTELELMALLAAWIALDAYEPHPC
jgi:hypothetical protein